MSLSVIVCTYRRAEDLRKLLACLAAQICRDFEVLVVDGSGEDTAVRDAVSEFANFAGRRLLLRWIPSPQGLTRQRNIGLREYRGDIVCFLDDDVTMGEGFVSHLVDLFQQPEMENVGGIGGYDTLCHASQSFRRRLRRRFAHIRRLRQGTLDYLGRPLPAISEPFTGCRDVEWLGGFCMSFRRAAAANVWFDESLPTYGGEDVDFSQQIGERWRLIQCGDLHVQHHLSGQNRIGKLDRMYQCGWGEGWRFAKRMPGKLDYFVLIAYLTRDLILDSVIYLASRGPSSFRLPLTRIQGTLHGLRSFRQQHASLRDSRYGRHSQDSPTAQVPDVDK